MFVLAVLCLLAAAGLVLWVLFGLNGEANNSIHFSAMGITTDLKPLTLFGLGALTLLLIWAATRLFAAGTRHKYRSHKERKALEKENERSIKEREALTRDRDEAQAERDRLAREREMQATQTRGVAGSHDEYERRDLNTERGAYVDDRGYADERRGYVDEQRGYVDDRGYADERGGRTLGDRARDIADDVPRRGRHTR